MAAPRRALAAALVAIAARAAAAAPKPVAGGAGYALLFDRTKEDIAALKWNFGDSEMKAATVEYWMFLTDAYQDTHTPFAYSAYDPDQTPSYSAPKELGIAYKSHSPLVTVNRGSTEEDCTLTSACRRVKTGWNHFAITWDSATQYIAYFINGERMMNRQNGESITKAPLVPGGQFALGQSPSDFASGYDEYASLDGVMDMLRVWNYAKSESEVQNTWYLPTGATVDNEDGSGLMLTFAFDEPMSSEFDRAAWANISLVEGTNYKSETSQLTLGQMAVLKNEMIYATTKESTPPSAPTFVVSTAGGLVGKGSPVVVRTSVGTAVDVDLPAYSVTDFHVYITELPTNGKLYQLTWTLVSGQWQATQGTEITATATKVEHDTANWCDNKSNAPSAGIQGQANYPSNVVCPRRVRFVPDANFGTSNPKDVFKYRAVTAAYPGAYTEAGFSAGSDAYVTAAVEAQVHLRSLRKPENVVLTVTEDEVSFLVLGGFSDAGVPLKTKITSKPAKGRLFPVTWAAGDQNTYKFAERDIAVLADQFNSKEITTFPYTIDNDRGVVLFASDPDESGTAYTTFPYVWVEEGTESDPATATIDVSKANDAPNKDLLEDQKTVCSTWYNTDTTGGCYLSMDSGTEPSIRLNGTDVDSPLSPSGAERLYFTITTYPKLGTLYQVYPGNRTAERPISSTPVRTGVGWVLNAMNASSQATNCAAETNCESPWLCDMTASNPACTDTTNHVVNIEDAPPEYGREAASFTFSTADGDGTPSWFEVEIHPGNGELMYLTGIELYETNAPGGVTRISTAATYDGSNTMWRDVYSAAGTTPRESDRVWEPKICALAEPVGYVRFEVDQTNALNAKEKFAAVYFSGKVNRPEGMVTHEELAADGTALDYGRVVFRPEPGLHVKGNTIFDTFKYKTSDCVDQSADEMPVHVSVYGPSEPDDYCTGGLDGCKWMDYAETFGYFREVPVRYMPTDEDALYQIPMDGPKAVMQALGLSSDSDLCSMWATMTVKLYWSRFVNGTTLYTAREEFGGGWKKGSVNPAQGDYESTIDSTYGSCPTDNSREQVYAFYVNAPYSTQGSFEVDAWMTFQPSATRASYYTVRQRLTFAMACPYNQTHTHYYDASISDGQVARRSAYNATGMCDDCYCNPALDGCPTPDRPSYPEPASGVCKPCHLLTEDEKASIMTGLERYWFQDVCAALFEEAPAGHYLNQTHYDLTGYNEFVPCPAGTYNPGGFRNTECTRCAKATYYPETGAAKCLSCQTFGTDLYSDTEGSSTCLMCPRDPSNAESGPSTKVNQSLPDGLRATNISDCICREGFYSPTGETGVVCEACPEGAYCMGGLEKPVGCGEAVWNNETLINNPDTNVGAYCVEDDGGYWGQRDFPTKFFQSDGAVGGWEGTGCADDRDGTMCAFCKEGYFDMGGISCIECPETETQQIIMTVGGVSCLLVVWLVMNVLLSSDYDTLDLFLLYVQILSLASSFGVNWPGDNKYTIMGLIFTVLDFDVDFMQPNCVMEWGYEQSFYLQLFIPIIMLMFAYLHYVYAKLSRRVHETAYEDHNPFMRLIHRLTRYYSENDIKNVMDRDTNYFLQYLVMSYNVFAVKAFSAFVCEDLADGTSVLVNGPDIVCGGSKHIPIIIVAIFSIFIYALGVPLVFLCILYYGKKNDLLAHPRFLRTFGWIYTRFETEYYWWELTTLFRRGFFCLVTVFLADEPYVQCATGIVFMMATLCTHYNCRPYRIWYLDLIDSVACISTMIYLVSGILFQASPRFQYYNTLKDLNFAMVCVTGVLIFIYTVVDIVNVNALRRSQKIIEERVIAALEGVGVAYADMGDNPEDMFNQFNQADVDKSGELSLEEFRNKIKQVNPDIDEVLIESMFEICDADGDGTISYKEFRDYLWRQQAVRGSAAQDVEDTYCFGLLKGKKSSDLDKMRSALKAKVTNAVESNKHALVGDFVNTLRVGYLRSFVTREPEDANFVRFHQVDTWLTPFVTNDSDVSTYSMAPHAVLFRELATGVPFLLDWVVTASTEDKLTLRMLIDSFMSCRSTVGPDGIFSQAIKQEDRGPVLYWLLQASPEQSLVFWELLDRVMETSMEPNDPPLPAQLLPPGAAKKERVALAQARGEREMQPLIEDAALEEAAQQEDVEHGRRLGGRHD